jgi:hypothetical protein
MFVFSCSDYGCLEIQTALNFKVGKEYACRKDVYVNLVCCTHHRLLLLVVVKLRFL